MYNRPRRKGQVAKGEFIVSQGTHDSAVLTQLAETPARIGALTADLTPAQLRTRPGPDEWSVNDVLAHLRACADVRGGVIPTILQEDHPTVRAVNPRTYMTTTDYPNLEFDPSFHAFTTQRAELLAMLQALPPESWSRSATVSGAGKTLENTVLHYAEWIAEHERPHVRQIAQVATQSEQRRRSMQVNRDSVSTNKGPAQWFTGDVYVDFVASPTGPSRLQANVVRFTPGARTAWHSHPNGQTLYVLDGVGRAQGRGGPVETITPGDRVTIGPGEEHWHGAAPDRFMAHFSFVEVDDAGNSATWGDT